MSEWSDFCSSAGRLFDKATQEAVRLGDTATLYVKLKNAETRRDMEYQELGRLTYQRLRRNADNAAQIDEILERIESFDDQAAAIKAEIERLKKKNGEKA